MLIDFSSEICLFLPVINRSKEGSTENTLHAFFFRKKNYLSFQLVTISCVNLFEKRLLRLKLFLEFVLSIKSLIRHRNDNLMKELKPKQTCEFSVQQLVGSTKDTW